MPPSSPLEPARLEALIDAAVALALERHPAQVEALAKSVVEESFGNQLPNEIGALMRSAEGMAPEFVAGILVGAARAGAALSGDQRLELVWTGPRTPLVSSRRTEQVLLGIIDSAQHEIFLTTFVASHADALLDALRRATDRSVAVSILLEDTPGGTTKDAILAMHARLPDATFFDWARGPGYERGKVHAKTTVADAARCLVTSANLTGRAMDENMEVGVFIEGGDIPRTLAEHFRALITTGVLEPWTG